MKLSRENATKLDALIWRDRLRRWGVPLAAVAIVFAVLITVSSERLKSADTVVSISTHEAHFLRFKRVPVRGLSVISAHLDDGRDVDAANTFPDILSPGATITIAQSRHTSGQLTYSVLKIAH